MEHYSDIEKDEILSSEPIWMDAEGIMLRILYMRIAVLTNVLDRAKYHVVRSSLLAQQ